MGHRYGSKLAMTTYQVPDRPVDLTGARFENQGQTTELSDWHSSVAYTRNTDNTFSEAVSFTALQDDPKMRKYLQLLEDAETLVKAKYGRTSDQVQVDVCSFY